MANSTSTNPSFLDDIFGSETFDKLSSFGERLLALKWGHDENMQQAQQVQTPMQNLFGDNTETAQTVILYGVSALVLGVAVYFVFKKL